VRRNKHISWPGQLALFVLPSMSIADLYMVLKLQLRTGFDQARDQLTNLVTLVLL